MPLWTMTDNASSLPISAPAQLNQTPNTANRNALYGNTTADAYIVGTTTGVYAVDDTEIHIANKVVTAVAANNHGSGSSYIPGDLLTANAAGATFAAAAKFQVVTTRARTVSVGTALGAGYANGDTVTCNTGVMTTNAVFTVTTGASNTSIASLALTTNGVFTTNPTLANAALQNITVANAAANGATATVTMGVDTIGVLDHGVYSIIPTNITSMIPANGANGSGTGLTMVLTFASQDKGLTHTGWIKRTTGTGGRAGRVQTEVLVAGGVTSSNTGDDSVFPDTD